MRAAVNILKIKETAVEHQPMQLNRTAFIAYFLSYPSKVLLFLRWRNIAKYSYTCLKRKLKQTQKFNIFFPHSYQTEGNTAANHRIQSQTSCNPCW